MVISYIYQTAFLTMHEILLEEFAKNIPKPQAVIAVQVYLELVEVKRYYSVEYHFNQTINKMIITGKKRKEASLCAFIPISCTEYLDFSILQNFITSHSYSSTFLVIVGPDTTSVYYELKHGLVEPEDTSAKHARIDRQHQLDRELEKNRDFIEEAALLGLKVQLPEMPGTSFQPEKETIDDPRLSLENTVSSSQNTS